MRYVYLDNAATTNLSPQVKDYVIELINNDCYGNPSSKHYIGNKAKDIVETARDNVYNFLHTTKEDADIIFTSSGSASNTLAISSFGSYRKDNIILYSPTAHKSMIESCKQFNSQKLTVDKNGKINELYLTTLLKCYQDFRITICIEAANSEIGTIQDIKKLSSIAKHFGCNFIVDVTGYIPYCEVNFNDWSDVDIITFSAHKLNSLKGIGVLCKRKDIILSTLIYGSQEQGLFGGTENVLGIGALGKAVEAFNYTFVSSEKRTYFVKEVLSSIPNCYLVGSEDNRLPYNAYICFRGADGEALMHLLSNNGICVSTGSACSSSDRKPSNTLTAINLNKDDMHSCIRFTLSHDTNYDDLDYCIEKLVSCVELLRATME